ncbi:MAG: hypothetical protein QOI03_938 [Solirubrobacteraceae bacterium]|jgi:hypothetical protein|nr:hypothetical protein [Solirubrobacteraceae bacterium]
MNTEHDPVRPLDSAYVEARSETRRERARLLRARRTRRRRIAASSALIVLIAALLLALGVQGGGARHPSGARARGSLAARHASAPRASASKPAQRVQHARVSRPSIAASQPPAGAPGTLPQTHAYPSAESAQFKAQMAALWAGIASDSPASSIPAFFPKAAYLQLKAIAAAGPDWSNRLVADYALDIRAAHALLGAGASQARLLRVQVPSSYGHWIPPGVCDNSIGYYEMPNARVVYRENGVLRSFGIASMISWRGVWYVVHLGAILRESDAGVVDEPASGSGASAYSATC